KMDIREQQLTIDQASPKSLSVKTENIPAELKAIPHWVLWRWDWDDGKQKWVKCPYQVANPTRRASSTNRSTWSDFDSAISVYQRSPNVWAGLFFALAEPYVGIDFDHFNPTDSDRSAKIKEIVQRFDSYAEASPR